MPRLPLATGILSGHDALVASDEFDGVLDVLFRLYPIVSMPNATIEGTKSTELLLPALADAAAVVAEALDGLDLLPRRVVGLCWFLLRELTEQASRNSAASDLYMEAASTWYEQLNNVFGPVSVTG